MLARAVRYLDRIVAYEFLAQQMRNKKNSRKYRPSPFYVAILDKIFLESSVAQLQTPNCYRRMISPIIALWI